MDGSCVSNQGQVEVPVELPADREVLQKFIELYETLPELWDASNPEYMNKNKRNRALDRLLVVYSKLKVNATREDVRKKINTLRSNYRKELKKIVESKRSGIGADDIYQPSSWVFYALQFLNKAEVPAVLSVQENSQEGAQHESSNDLRESPVETGPMTSSPTPTTSMSSINKMQPPIKKRRVQGKASKRNELLALACDYLSRPSNEDDKEYNLAKVWAQQLKELEPRQKLYVEKAISDILFEARLGNLNNNSVQMNVNTRHSYDTIYSPSCSTSTSASPSISVHVPSPQPEVQYIETSEDVPIDRNMITLFTTFKPTGE